MFIVHVHCSLFMFIVHCSHGATLIFDDVFDQLRKGLYGLYRVWQEGGDGRQGEVEGPGEVGVGEPLLGVLRQQGVEG